MTISVRKMADKYFDGDRNKASEAAGVSLYLFNNWVSQGREVMRLEDGNFILISSKTKIIKNILKVSETNLIDANIVSYLKSASKSDLSRAKTELESEMANGELSDEKYLQELKLINKLLAK